MIEEKADSGITAIMQLIRGTRAAIAQKSPVPGRKMCRFGLLSGGQKNM